MATYLVWSGGDGTAPSGTDWTKAAATLQAALTLATTANDVVKVHYAHAETGTTLTLTAGASISVISVDKDNSDALRAQTGTGYFRATAGTLSISSSFRCHFYGLNIYINSNVTRVMALADSDGSHHEYESCQIEIQHASSSGSSIRAIAVGDAQAFLRFKKCTLLFNAASNFLAGNTKMVLDDCIINKISTAPTSLVQITSVDPGGAEVTFAGCDLSGLGSAALVGATSSAAMTVRFSQCKLGAAFSVATLLATQTNLNRSAAEVYLYDCFNDDTHGMFAYVNAMGSVWSDTGIYFTAGAAAQSWKIVTTANCSFYTPFETPWFGYYNTGTSAITPYVEILRDGSATAYQDDEVWVDIAAKVTTGSTASSLYSDRMTLLGTPANQAAGAGLGSWTGETTTGAPDAWSGKLALGSSITPAEVGHIQARIVVGEPSITVYADPQIRT